MMTDKIPTFHSTAADTATLPVQTSAHPAKAPAYCVNCVHIRHADKPAPFCAAVISHVSPVFGPRHEYCQLARAESGECGVEGRLFTAQAAARVPSSMPGWDGVERIPAFLRGQPQPPARAWLGALVVVDGREQLTTVLPAASEDVKYLGAVVIYGPQGCGKTQHEAALAKHFGKKYAVDYEQLIPGSASFHELLVTTNADLPGAIPFEEAMSAAGLPILKRTPNPSAA